MSNTLKVGIVGASGYTGSELVRLLMQHPYAEITYITSESSAGKEFATVHPSFHQLLSKKLISVKEAENVETDVVFLALPHGVSMDFAPRFLEKGRVVIDLSGDYRLEDAKTYAKWYGQDHKYLDWLEKAVYGLPELNREQVKKAQLIANPGCYPTASILGASPAVHSGLADAKIPIIVDAKSGTTGAGIKLSATTHYSSLYGNFFAYKAEGHRHQPEITQTLQHLSKEPLRVRFTPHLLPVDRGILATIYIQPSKPTTTEALQTLYKEFYNDQAFVRVSPQPPHIKQVKGSNYCDVYPMYDEENEQIIVFSAIDNLVKGAAGQAVQNMNIRFELQELTGLEQAPLNP